MLGEFIEQVADPLLCGNRIHTGGLETSGNDGELDKVRVGFLALEVEGDELELYPVPGREGVIKEIKMVVYGNSLEFQWIALVGCVKNFPMPWSRVDACIQLNAL